MQPLEIVGFFGLISLVGTFLLQSVGVFDKRKIPFYFINAVGAGFLAYYAIATHNVYFAILEGVWCAGAFVCLGNIFLKNYKNGFREKR